MRNITMPLTIGPGAASLARQSLRKKKRNWGCETVNGSNELKNHYLWKPRSTVSQSFSAQNCRKSDPNHFSSNPPAAVPPGAENAERDTIGRCAQSDGNCLKP